MNKDFHVLTRAKGVRKENPIMTVGKYFPGSNTRTPELREEADKLMGFDDATKEEVKRSKRLKNTYDYEADNYINAKTRSGQAFEGSDFKSDRMKNALKRMLKAGQLKASK